MAATASPNGLRAVNLIGGLPYAGSTRSFPITLRVMRRTSSTALS